MPASPNSTTSERLLALILSSLDDDKAEDIVQIDLRGKSSIGDYMVVCSGRSSRQVAAISELSVPVLRCSVKSAVRSQRIIALTRTTTTPGAPIS